MADERSNKNKAIDMALTQIEKQFGKGSIMRLGDRTDPSGVRSISTGSISLDAALGVGGFPKGRVVEIFGPESSGKTTLALHAIAQSQKVGGSAAFIDAEHAMDASYAKLLGVNTDELLVSQPDSGEQALEIAEVLVRSGAIDILVVDSVAALVPKAELEGEMGDSLPGLAGPIDVSGPAQANRDRVASPIPAWFSSTRCGKKSASCSATRKPPPEGGRSSFTPRSASISGA